MSHTEYDVEQVWNKTGDETPITVLTGNFGEMYHYEVVGYLNPSSNEPDDYSWFDVFVDDECINLGEVLTDETAALVYFMNWVANELVVIPVSENIHNQIEEWKKV